MELDYLNEFIVTAETANFFEASEKLFISQSSLSRHIKSIEEDLGYSLFERTARKVKLNHYGELFLPYAKEILRLQRNYQKVLEAESQKKIDVINVATVSTCVDYNVMEIITLFREEHPEYQINIFDSYSVAVEEKLRAGECDFAFTIGSEDDISDFQVIPLTTDSLVLVVPKNHRYACEKIIDLKLLKNNPFVLYGKESYIYNLSYTACAKAGFRPKSVFTSYRFETIMDMIGKEMGVTLMPLREALEHKTENIRIVRINPQIQVEIRLLYHPIFNMRQIHKEFISSVGLLLNTENQII